MIKKIPVSQLISGMYVHDLNCKWLDHPFALSQFKIAGNKEISKIRSVGIRELYIDTDKGFDIEDAKSVVEVQSAIEDRLYETSEPAQPVVHDVSLREEMKIARKVRTEASNLVTGIMSDVKLGKQIEIDRVQPVVENMVSSILRNEDALLGLTRIRRMDKYTFEHSVGVAVLLVSFAKTLGLDWDTTMEIGIGGLLHDVGKSLTPDHILNKPGRLTDEEFAVMRQHVVHSRDILNETKGVPETSIAIAAEHHERFDGSGYPDRKRGDEISLYGRMAAIVDVYDALTADRVYHQGQLPNAALGKLIEWSKFHFHPELVQKFIHCVGIYPVGTLVKLESGKLAVVIESGSKGLLYPVVRVFLNTKTRSFLSPFEIDLSSDAGQHEKIASAESPERWRVQVEDVMEQG